MIFKGMLSIYSEQIFGSLLGQCCARKYEVSWFVAALTNSQNTGDPSSRVISLFCDCFERQHILRKFITTSVYLLQSASRKKFKT
jgi:ribosome biogenesis protein Nip4